MIICAACEKAKAKWAVLISIIDGNDFAMLCDGCTKMSAWSVAADESADANARVGGFDPRPLMDNEDFELYVIMSMERYNRIIGKGKPIFGMPDVSGHDN